jgi:single-stranded DNA-binding protein
MSKSNTNEVVTSGTLSATPEFTSLPSGTRQARFEIDTVERRRNRRFHNYPAFFAYGKMAEQLEEKGLTEGDSIAVEGKLRTSELDLVVEGETIVSQQTQEVEKWDATWVKVERVKTGDLAVEDTNVAKISGTLATDIDFTPTNRGTPRARFVVDSVEFRGQEEFVNSLSVTVYNAEVLAQLEAAGLSKGDAVELEGALQTRLSGVEVDGEKLVYKSGKNAGKQVRRKIAWITAGRVDEVDLKALGETSVSVSGEQPAAEGVSRPQPSPRRFRIRDLLRLRRGRRRSRH